MPEAVFPTSRRIRLGIWGLGRGMSFYRLCRMVNFDVVAGCDYNAHMRDNFLSQNPGAFVTDDAEKFLSRDFDAVLLATYCPSHAEDAIRCLQAGKHVLSEVTSFFTMAEGVRLVEEVERSGLVYNLAENYPFTAANMYLASKYEQGLFGELMYAEYEYVHECRSLCYTYIDGTPVQPGHTVHNWRSWFNYHYYCTHSLGPMMVITGTRPTRVVSLPGAQRLSGYIANEECGGVAPSLINMSNGAVVRNLMGATTNDTHYQRLWGTRGGAEVDGKRVFLRLGGSGGSPKLEVKPQWPALGQQAEAAGHGGGDFWILYYFARQILLGQPAPFDIYSASDVTIPGILARRSAMDGGRPYDVPDFRDKAQRDAYRHDNETQARFDTIDGPFPKDADRGITEQFASTMKDLIACALQYRAYTDWEKVSTDVSDPKQLLAVAEKMAETYPKLQSSYASARKIIDAYPASEAARVLREMLEDVGEGAKAIDPAFLPTLQRRIESLGGS